MRICLAALVFVLWGCPKPNTTITKKVVEPTPTKSTKSLQELMRAAQELSDKASSSLSAPETFAKLSGELASNLLVVRDQHSPEPSFYQLADASYQAATQGAAPSTPEERAAQWEKVQRTCQACHLRYGGPVSKVAEVAPRIDSYSRSNP